MFLPKAVGVSASEMRAFLSGIGAVGDGCTFVKGGAVEVLSTQFLRILQFEAERRFFIYILRERPQEPWP